ncbi:MAG: ribonuclease HI family protein [Acidobacteriota bacterium]
MQDKQLNFLIDGASRGNPGPAGFGIVVYDAEWQKADEIKGQLGVNTNNYAEYMALIKALEHALEKGAMKVRVYSDSELIVWQMKGKYKIKSKNIIPLARKAFTLVRQLKQFDIKKIPRAKNKKADLLANEAIDSSIEEKRR